MCDPAKKTAIKSSGVDGLPQNLLTDSHLGGKSHVQKVGVGTRVNED